MVPQAPVEGRYVGIDLCRPRSVTYTMTAEGEKVSCVQIATGSGARSFIASLRSHRRRSTAPQYAPGERG
jgi:hypothetical protein